MKKNKDPYPERTTEWLQPNAINRHWLEKELERSKLPGHAERKIIEDRLGRLALARV